MADQGGSAAAQENTFESKGKGKATEADTGMEVDDSSSEEEIDENEATVDEPDEDNMEEIDLDNIIEGGRRTRGRTIDFAKAAEEFPEEDEEEDDDDFEAPEDDDKMEE